MSQDQKCSVVLSASAYGVYNKRDVTLKEPILQTFKAGLTH